MLADLLDKLACDTPGGDPPPADRPVTPPGDDLGTARELIEEAAAAAAELGGWTPAEPLRLWKDRVTWLLHCPRRAVAADEPSADGLDDIAVGLLVDAAAKLLTLGAARPVTAETALGYLAAQADDRVLPHLTALGEVAAAELLAEADTRIDQLCHLWPDPGPDWWPRVEEPVRVPLAGGAVVLGGRLDVMLGGPPTDRPAVIIEIKSGRWRDQVRSDAHLYGLLVALRDGRAPHSVVTLAAREGQTQVEPVRPAVLHHMAERVVTALEEAARLAAGEVPRARGGSHCATCPLTSTCPEAVTAGDGVTTPAARRAPDPPASPEAPERAGPDLVDLRPTGDGEAPGTGSTGADTPSPRDAVPAGDPEPAEHEPAEHEPEAGASGRGTPPAPPAARETAGAAG